MPSLADLATRIGQEVKRARWSRGNIATTTDLNTFLTDGEYTITGSGVLNRPVTGVPVNLEVFVPGTGPIIQRATTIEASPKTFVRSSVGGVWGNWLNLSTAQPVPVNAGSDMDTLTIPGTYQISSSSVTNKPTTGLGLLETFPMPASGIIQRWTPFATPTGEIWYRIRSGGTWQAWYTGTWWGGNLGIGINFDTLTTPRAYSIQSITHPNQPIAETGTLTVTASGNSIIHRFDALTSGTTYRRTRNPSGTWTAWENTTPVTVSAATRELSAWSPTLTSRPVIDIVKTMSRSRLVGFNGSIASGELRFTRDDGATWQGMHTFPSALSHAWVLPNGELLAAVGTGTEPRSLWKSNDYTDQNPTAATWTKTLESSGPSIYFSSGWGYSAHENIVLVAEYGPKTTADGAVTSPARYVYLSLDSGDTWTTIFDLVTYLTTDRGLTTTHGQHVHGVAWDKWWDRIWVTFGDDTNGMVFSDDLGKTWHTADWGPAQYGSGQHQAVGIAPMRDCILLGSDSEPNGVWRVSRAPGKHSDTYAIEEAWTVPDDQNRLTHLCHSIHRVATPDGEVILFGFGTETVPGHTFIVGTRDGVNFRQVWVDSLEIPAGRGIRTIAGPTLRGELIVGSHDERVANSWSEWRGPSPTY